MAILPTLFFAACLGEEKTIIVGDPRQLPPIVQSDSVFARRALGRNIFDVAVGPSGDAAPVALLDTQYRMHPSIGRLVGELFYDGRITNGASTSERESIAAAAPYPGHAVVVLDTSSRTRCRRDERSGSRINETSADLCVELACQAADRGARTVAVITPYAAQSRAVRERFGRRRGARGIECSTIHRFQGQERDVVIIDLVDTEPMRPGKLLADGPGSAAPQLLNVSVSRAAGKLILVADVEYFETRAPQSTVTAVLRQAGQQGTRVTADFGASVSTP
jgi:superfamily I DNA and/or RNA helicase